MQNLVLAIHITLWLVGLGTVVFLVYCSFNLPVTLVIQ